MSLTNQEVLGSKSQYIRSNLLEDNARQKETRRERNANKNLSLIPYHISGKYKKFCRAFTTLQAPEINTYFSSADLLSNNLSLILNWTKVYCLV